MAKTLAVAINITARLVITSELEKTVEETRKALREFKEKDPLAFASRGELLDPRAQVQAEWLVGGMGTEELVEKIFRAQFRAYAATDLAGELSVDGLVFDRVQTKVSYEGKKASLSAPECLHCRVLHNAGRPYKCGVCRSVDAKWEAGDI